MKEKQIPWSLNSLGAFAGELMLKDEEYIRQTRRLILSEREKMYSALKEQPAYKTYKPYANFLLVKLLQKETTAFDVFTHCVKNGLMIRDCSYFKSLDENLSGFVLWTAKTINVFSTNSLSYAVKNNINKYGDCSGYDPEYKQDFIFHLYSLLLLLQM